MLAERALLTLFALPHKCSIDSQKGARTIILEELLLGIYIYARRRVELTQVNVSKRRNAFDLVGWLRASQNAGCCFYYLLVRMSRGLNVVVPDYAALGILVTGVNDFPSASRCTTHP